MPMYRGSLIENVSLPLKGPTQRGHKRRGDRFFPRRLERATLRGESGQLKYICANARTLRIRTRRDGEKDNKIGGVGEGKDAHHRGKITILGN